MNMLWHCNTPPSKSGIFCTDCNGGGRSSYAVQNGDKNSLRIDRLLPTEQQGNWDISCVNDTVQMLQWQYIITNNGIGAIDSVFIILTEPNDIPGYLTLIPRSSLSKIIHCKACHVTDSIITTRSNALCGNLISDPLFKEIDTISTFYPGDTIYINFKTFRCVDENNPALLNNDKYFNNWILKVSGKSICNMEVDVDKTNAHFYQETFIS